MFPYFPFSHDQYKMTMGVQALHADHIIEVDNETYQAEMSLKDTLLLSDSSHYFQAPPETAASQWEVIALLLPAMARRYPDYFSLTRQNDNWIWHNHLRKQTTSFGFGVSESLPLSPLDWMGRQVQEDLLIVSGASATELPLVAGLLCFPNAWSLDEKMGKPFLALHEEVPLFVEHIGRSSQLLLHRLKMDRPVWRLNWALKTTPRLNLTPRFFHEIPPSQQGLTLENIGERCFLRVERQVLARLPLTHAILFTIHTYQIPLSTIALNSEQSRRMAAALRTVPFEIRVYKDIHLFVDMVIAYLAGRA